METLRTIVNLVSDLMFWVTDGELLINTFWVLPFILVCSLIAGAGIFTLSLLPRGKEWIGFAIAIPTLVIFGMMIAVGVSSLQMDLMSICETETAVVSTNLVDSTEVSVQQCRTRSNINDDYGDWQINRVETVN